MSTTCMQMGVFLHLGIALKLHVGVPIRSSSCIRKSANNEKITAKIHELDTIDEGWKPSF